LASGLKTDHQRSTLFSLNFCLDNGEYLSLYSPKAGENNLYLSEHQHTRNDE
jgi:hypothetical protein